MNTENDLSPFPLPSKPVLRLGTPLFFNRRTHFMGCEFVTWVQSHFLHYPFSNEFIEQRFNFYRRNVGMCFEALGCDPVRLTDCT